MDDNIKEINTEKLYTYGLVQNCGNFRALAMESLQFCTEPSKPPSFY